MTKINPFKQLDKVLRIINKEKSTRWHQEKIFEVLKNDNYPLLKEILKKLVKDTYLRPENILVPSNDRNKMETKECYILTFEGILFIEKGGYKWENIRSNISIFLKFSEAFAIAFGTLAAGIYAVYQIYQYYS